MIKTCQHCGAVNGDPSDLCCFCDAPLGGLGRSSVSRRVATPTEGNLAVEPEWRREVSSRLQDYRARRRGGASAELQSALPFESDPSRPLESSRARMEFASQAPAKKTVGTRAHRNERFEISIPNLETAAVGSHAHWPATAPPGASLSHAHLYSVASLPERRRAAIVDVGLLLFSYGGMLALFTVLGGHIGFNKVDLSVAVATLALFYAQYFALFTVFGGSTPGMMLRGLRVVSFDGGIPTSRQMAWRSFGYLISAGTCFLGFVWALWDEDQLCWQDRISQTYLTPAEKIAPY
ncbi:MAG: RDD family protein [Candidatus Acidiferrales bacterium]